MEVYGQDSAQLDLSQGTPRFYIMRLPARGLQFGNITHHKRVSQCLGGLSDKPWYMAVARSGLEEPQEEDIEAFEVPPGTFIKLEAGTWHAGPLFDEPQTQDFYNLELSDTNQNDHYNTWYEAPIQVRL
eukprot:CAMPEP_0196584238 /NCGR_PEP_ID=MMETSP1081-20130531/46293_1 /TAXON_ID=36882 /ORGANISM="Pyramimonas amylifera, Strain CCMP720" /LENGTH=128 /DNA_ID=CAMNT_0041905375 /DNA_START=469 /DNA_END=855 /DNA_ORIENTATION=-